MGDVTEELYEWLALSSVVSDAGKTGRNAEYRVPSADCRKSELPSVSVRTSAIAEVGIHMGPGRQEWPAALRCGSSLPGWDGEKITSIRETHGFRICKSEDVIANPMSPQHMVVERACNMHYALLPSLMRNRMPTFPTELYTQKQWTIDSQRLVDDGFEIGLSVRHIPTAFFPTAQYERRTTMEFTSTQDVRMRSSSHMKQV